MRAMHIRGAAVRIRRAPGADPVNASEDVRAGRQVRRSGRQSFLRADRRLDSFEKIWTDLVPGFTVQEVYRLGKEIGTHHVVELARATLQTQGYVRCRLLHVSRSRLMIAGGPAAVRSTAQQQ